MGPEALLSSTDLFLADDLIVCASPFHQLAKDLGDKALPLCHWLLKVALQIPSCVQEPALEGSVYMAAGVWAGARGGYHRLHSPLITSYPHPAPLLAWEVLLGDFIPSFPQVSATRPLSTK